MAGGGIIAFAAGDQVKANPRQDFKSLLEDKLRQDLTGAESDPYAGSKALAQQYGEEMKARQGQDVNMALMNTAAGMLSGESPYFFTNVGRGAQEGIKSLGTSAAQRQADKRLLLSQAVEAEKSADARKTAKTNAITGALSNLYNKELAAQIAQGNAAMSNAFREQTLMSNAYAKLGQETKDIAKELFKANRDKYNFEENSQQLLDDARKLAIERTIDFPGMRELLKMNSPAITETKTNATLDKGLGSSTNPLPMTSKDPKDYVTGKFYKTPRGTFEWAGNGFKQ